MKRVPSFSTATLASATVSEPPPPFPYQGSKRKLAVDILACIPDTAAVLHEPFCGSAAVALAAAKASPVLPVRLNDNNTALAALWQSILDHPQDVADGYATLWHEQLDRPRDFYDDVRKEFNANRDPVLFLYLLARCVKAAVRFNAYGDFNQSPDNRRLGAHPDRMQKNILAASTLLHGRTTVSSLDFTEALAAVTPADVVYMDPPYQGVSSSRDRRYLDVMQYDTFVDALDAMNRSNVSYIISYDGRTGTKVHGKSLPSRLNLRHFDIDAGRSSQSTLAGRSDHTVESLYLSEPLIERLGGSPEHLTLAAISA
jgi:DNA adenine methylase